MTKLDPRLQKRLRALEARHHALLDEIQARQTELRDVQRDLRDLRHAVDVIEGTSEPGRARQDERAAGTSLAVPNAARMLSTAIRRLEVGSVGFQAVGVLSAAGKPLHGDEIAAQLEALGYPVRPHTVAVTLGRMAREGRAVVKVAPNTFELDGSFFVGNPPFDLGGASNAAILDKASNEGRGRLGAAKARGKQPESAAIGTPRREGTGARPGPAGADAPVRAKGQRGRGRGPLRRAQAKAR